MVMKKKNTNALDIKYVFTGNLKADCCILYLGCVLKKKGLCCNYGCSIMAFKQTIRWH